MLSYPPGLEPETLEALANTFDNYAQQGNGLLASEDCGAANVDFTSNLEVQQWLSALEGLQLEGGAFDTSAWPYAQYEQELTAQALATLEAQTLASAMLKDAWHLPQSPVAWQLGLNSADSGWASESPWTQQPGFLSTSPQKANLSPMSTPPAAKAPAVKRYRGKSLIDIAAKNQEKRQESVKFPAADLPAYIQTTKLSEEFQASTVAPKTAERPRLHRRGKSLIDMAAKAKLGCTQPQKGPMLINDEALNLQERMNDQRTATPSDSGSQDSGEHAPSSGSGSGSKTPEDEPRKESCKSCGATQRSTFKFCIYCGSSMTK
jgi:hypothetical protein